ncbi:MFS general substrate transporter [Auriscalpium vulgare]|uniref:MFS general substrate transporter n=1 Tax=Auriscalpium vulgare TaxID=40419 RepID=A0ACB8RI85_9AGAM|nr:MFS general substrate transporter [Auriscalpium vulgare]
MKSVQPSFTSRATLLAPPPPPKPHATHVVDGGRRAWCTLVGAWLAFAATFGYTYSFGVYQDFYTRSHAASASRISWIGSTQCFLIIAIGLPAGKLHDMGYFRHVVLTGSIIYTFSLFMLSFARPESYYQLFLSQGVGMGIGAGLVYVPSLAVQAQHWRARRSLAMGIVSSGVPAGGIIFPILLNQVFQTSVGFAWTVRASAFLVLGMLVAANLLMSSYPPVAKVGQVKAGVLWLFKDIPYMLLAFSGLFMNWGLFFPYFYLQLFSFIHGMNATFSFYTLAILNSAGVLGRIIPNLFVKQLGPVNLAVAISVGCTAVTFSLLCITSVGGIVAFALLYGFCAGAYVSLISPALYSLSENEWEVGIRLGLALSLSSVGALTGPPIDGALLGDTFQWSKPIAFSGVCTFFSLGA